MTLFSLNFLSKIASSIIPLLFLSPLAYGQGLPTVNLYWVRYYNQAKLNKKLTWHNEFDERRRTMPDQQRQYIMHTHLNYRVGKQTDLGTGMTGSWVTRSNGLTVPETRPFQMVSFPMVAHKKFSLQFRFRTEERFFRNTDAQKTILTDGHNFKFRTRYRAQLQVPLDPSQTWTLRLADELMYHHLKGQVFSLDQNRIYAGIDLKISTHVNVELGYMRLHNPSENQNIARFTFYHRLDFTKD